MLFRSLQVESLEQAFEIEQAARDKALAARIEGFAVEAENDIISGEEAKEKIDEAEELAREEYLASLEAFEEKKAALLTESSEELIAIQAEAAKRETDISKKKVDKIIKEEERMKEGQKKAVEASLGVVSDLVGGVKDLLGQDEENRRKHAGIIKAIALGEIAINLIREISAISAANSTYPEPLGSIIKGIAIAKAVITAAIGVAKVTSSKFEFGGVIKEGEAAYTGEAPTGGKRKGAGSKIKAEPAPIVALSTSGILADMISPPKEPVVMRASPPPPSVVISGDDAMEAPLTHEGLPGYRPTGSVFVLGAGYVPSQGIIQGPDHSQRGVRVVTDSGELKELEGGEFLLRNGKEIYIINKRSTALFRRRLIAMTSNSNIYSHERRVEASNINTYKNYGVPFPERGHFPSKMASGGDLVSATKAQTPGAALATTIVSPPPPISQVDQGVDTALIDEIRSQNNLLQAGINAIDRKTEVLRNQVANIKLIVDPKEMVSQGLKQINEDANGAF